MAKISKYKLLMHRFSQGLQKNIEEWEQERRKLIIEEQEAIKIDKTFFEQSNLLLDFCKDCHNAFLKGNTEYNLTDKFKRGNTGVN